MSSTIQPTTGMLPAGATHRAGGAARAAAAFPLAPPSPTAVALSTFPATAPQSVLDDMSGAARVHDSLRAMGRELHFAHDEQSGRITIQVRDQGGRVLRTITPAEALDVAAGKPLE